MTVQNVQQTASQKMQTGKSAVAGHATIVGFEIHCRRRYRSFNTWISYRRGAEMLLEYFALTGAEVATMTEEDFGRFLYWLQYPIWVPGTEAVPPDTEGRQRATVRTYGAGALSYARYLKKTGMAVPPFFGVHGRWRDAAESAGIPKPEDGEGSLLPKDGKRQPMVVPVALLRALLRIAKKESARDYALLLLLLGTGLRIGEALGLRREDVDRVAGTVKVVRREDNVNRALAKGRYDRSVPLVRQVVAALNVYFQSDEYTDARRHAAPGHADYVFLTERRGRRSAKALSYDDVNQMLRALNKRAVKSGAMLKETRRMTAHMLRHTFATMAVEGGLTAEEARLVLGHRSVRTTLDTYVESSTAKVAKRLVEITERWMSTVNPKEDAR